MRQYFCIFALLCGALGPALFAVGEKHLAVGGKTGWGAVEAFDNIVELGGVRPAPVLSISSARGGRGERLDMYLSFDEGEVESFKDATGNYQLRTNDEVHVAGQRWARRGTGAALFSSVSAVVYQNRFQNKAPFVITPANSRALLAPGRALGDFSLEFFLFPNNLTSGEEILNWQASMKMGAGAENGSQTIVCVAAKNRLFWTFDNFWISPDNRNAKRIEFSSNIPIAVKMWSHHLVRFDSKTGLIEYLVDGVPQAALYASANGSEGGEVYAPVAGERGALLLGSDFTGLIDELKITGAFVELDEIQRYPARGGRVETKALDLGGLNSEVKKVAVSGGRVRLGSRALINQHEKNGDFRFADDSQLQFFIRTANSTGELYAKKWMPFKSGAEIFSLKGRYVQVAADFYPSGDGEASPYIEKITFEYQTRAAPVPPANLTAIARDGAVELSWKERGGEDAAGYLVYYGTKSGEYFCEDAGHGASPVDVGKAAGIRLDNLKNGALYYFALAAYDDAGVEYAGGFSREVSARPLRMLE